MTQRKDWELDLRGQVIALFHKDAGEAVKALREKGFETVVLEGDEGRKALKPTGDRPGLGATLKKLAAIYGDELRIIERLDRSLAEGKSLVAVTAEEEDKKEDKKLVVEVINAHGGESVWHFGEWTFEKLGDAN